MATTLTQPATRERTRTAVIDCDIHNALPSNKTLVKYLPERWRRHHETFGGRGHAGAYYPRANLNAARTDSWPPSGLPPGADLDFLREQLLDRWEMDYGVLNPLLGAGGQLNLDYGAAMAQAINDWQIAEWTEPESRLRASLVVAYEDGELAAEEIHRLGDHPHVIQILVTARTSEPLGRRKYWKMYEAALRHDLPIGIHFGGSGGGPITGAGWPSFYIEDHAGMPTAFEAQVISMVCEGIFERFPTLKIVLIEGGFGWLPSLMWRLDRSWKHLRDEVPHLRRLPSEYIREHFWITTQPMEEPYTPAHFHQFLEQLNMNDRLMFATDYPHWDFDAPDQAIPVKLAQELEQKIMSDNARALYRF
jgi:predicted TIM-barrel fold metal-dependent hydrolase